MAKSWKTLLNNSQTPPEEEQPKSPDFSFLLEQDEHLRQLDTERKNLEASMQNLTATNQEADPKYQQPVLSIREKKEKERKWLAQKTAMEQKLIQKKKSGATVRKKAKKGLSTDTLKKKKKKEQPQDTLFKLTNNLETTRQHTRKDDFEIGRLTTDIEHKAEKVTDSFAQIEQQLTSIQTLADDFQQKPLNTDTEPDKPQSLFESLTVDTTTVSKATEKLNLKNEFEKRVKEKTSVLERYKQKIAQQLNTGKISTQLSKSELLKAQLIKKKAEQAKQEAEEWRKKDERKQQKKQERNDNPFNI